MDVSYFKIDNMPRDIEFQTIDPLKRALQNAKNLIMCRMGEVPYDRYRGFNPQLFDLPIEEFRDELIPELNRIMMWEPDISVVSAEATLDESGEVYILVTVYTDIGERSA